MKSIDEIVNNYIKAAEKYGAETKKNNSNKANKQYVVMKKNYDLLKTENALNELVKHINHEEDYVKLWVAVHILEIDEKKAKKVLAQLSKKKEMIGFEAKMTLEHWNKGELKF